MGHDFRCTFARVLSYSFAPNKPLMPMNPSPLLLREPDRITEMVAEWRAQGQRIGFVPTMGALHEGHMALVEEARKHCDKAVVSIFVNPTQFGEGEDYTRYPRMVDRDIDLLSRHGCDLVWLPDVHHIYPDGFSTKVSIGNEITGILCGRHRAGHFDGVATVVSILLNTVRPDASFFGEKDYQQLHIIRRLAADLHLPGKVCGIPIVREADGLALSSRNQYLTPQERAVAPALYATLKWVRTELENRSCAEVLEEAQNRLLRVGFDAVDYLEIRHGDTLALLEENVAGGRVFVAAWLGKARLLDNLEL